ncbi:hypothetical protein N8H74_03765 [Pseudomonas sp. B2M1-30]|uniref:Uncharacterized protein n=1 Tax=Pseudomonas koreensis TaxID=198620 RepID=A0A9X2XJP3_9PSED|nr:MULTISPECIES: hypothetical protein [Pseudomonas]MBV4476785.1 hypothetical protein [Pseudomonas botevensis]MCU0117360.1 hypothetical protein [Pseudomonas sp. B2M1-30]MCU7249971.1 hypothetical protein [Pseudomonas koreensis]MCU7258896.1 hypothetical protein [Pseudomonas koreensis]
MNEFSSLELSIAPLDGENNIANANDYQVRFSNIFELTHSTGECEVAYSHARGSVRPLNKKTVNCLKNKALTVDS